MTIDAGVVDNSAGYIGAHDALVARTDGVVNARAGVVLGQADVTIATRDGAYDNRGGQTLAAGNLNLDAGGGTVHNAGALIRSAGTTAVMAGTVDNTATAGTDQGIEGRDVSITATRTMNNDAGAIRASGNVTVASSGAIRNVGGLMSAGDTLALVDPNRVDAATKTLSVVNTNGRLIADRQVTLPGEHIAFDLPKGVLASAVREVRINPASPWGFKVAAHDIAVRDTVAP